MLVTCNYKSKLLGISAIFLILVAIFFGMKVMWKHRQSEYRNTLRHSKNVYAISFSPDGRLLVCANGNILTVWDAPRTKRVGSICLSKHLDSPPQISPNGRTLATLVEAGNDLALDIRDLQTGGWIRTLRHCPSRYGYGLAFSPDGKSLAVGDWVDHIPARGMQAVYIYDTTTWLAKLILHGIDKGAIADVAFSLDGSQIAAFSVEKESEELELGIWDARTGKLIRLFTDKELQTDDSWQLFYFGSDSGLLLGNSLLSMAAKKTAWRAAIPNGNLCVGVYSAKQWLALAVSQRNTEDVDLFQVRPFKWKHRWKIPDLKNYGDDRFQSVNILSNRSLAFSPASRLLATLGSDGREIHLWRLDRY